MTTEPIVDHVAEPVPEIGLVAGWSYPATVFHPLQRHLEGRRVLAYDWSTFVTNWLDDAPCRPEPSVWLGWSLGGVLLLEAVRRGRIRPERLILVSTTPRFLAAPDWPGVPETAWRDLRRAVDRQPTVAVAAFRRRFDLPVADGVHGDPAGVDGLDWLARLDLRQMVCDLSVPTELWLAVDDPLVPSDWPSRLPVSSQVSPHALSAPGHGAWFQQPAVLASRLLAAIGSV